jgi:hypothetical protein
MIKREVIKNIKKINNTINRKNGKLREKELSKLIEDELLIEEYIKKERTSTDISKELDISNPYICKRLRKLGILRNVHERKEGTYNGLWKGDKISSNPLHGWVRRHKPKPLFCENCKKKEPYDLANISGKYKRDINDFKWLCRRCHMEEDGRLEKVREQMIKRSLIWKKQ